MLPLPPVQYEHERLGRHQTDGRLTAGTDPSAADTSSLRIENMELRRKIDDLETSKTEMQQKHLKEVRWRRNEMGHVSEWTPV